MNIKKILLSLLFISFNLIIAIGQVEEVAPKQQLQFLDEVAKKRVTILDNDFSVLRPKSVSGIKELRFINSDPNKVDELLWKKMVGVTNLYIVCETCTELPNGIGELPRLKKISLRTDKVDKLPKEFGNLKQLEEFKIITNATSLEFEGDLKAIGKLIIFEIRGENLNEISENLFNYNKARVVEINAENLAAFPTSIFEMKSVAHMKLYINSVPEIPGGIANMSKLSKLTLTFAGDKLPADFVQLFNLTEFVLTTPDSFTMSEGFSQLQKLKLLNIITKNTLILSKDFGTGQNYFRVHFGAREKIHFPKKCCQNFKAKNLGFYTEVLPEISSPMEGVETLTFISNLLKDDWENARNRHFDFSLFPSLKTVAIYRQNLRNTKFIIPKENNIEKLIFEECRLTKVPSSFSNLTKCTKLSIEKNDIKEIPNFLSQLPKLEELLR